MENLTLEQKFEMKRIEDAANNMSYEQAFYMFIKASRLLMFKDSILSQLKERKPLTEDVYYLSIEQEFKLKKLEQEFQKINRKQIINYLIATMEEIMLRDNLIKELMKSGLF